MRAAQLPPMDSSIPQVTRKRGGSPKTFIGTPSRRCMGATRGRRRNPFPISSPVSTCFSSETRHHMSILAHGDTTECRRNSGTGVLPPPHNGPGGTRAIGLGPLLDLKSSHHGLRKQVLKSHLPLAKPRRRSVSIGTYGTFTKNSGARSCNRRCERPGPVQINLATLSGAPQSMTTLSGIVNSKSRRS